MLACAETGHPFRVVPQPEHHPCHRYGKGGAGTDFRQSAAVRVVSALAGVVAGGVTPSALERDPS
jgi:hypothetical protein